MRRIENLSKAMLFCVYCWLLHTSTPPPTSLSPLVPLIYKFVVDRSRARGPCWCLVNIRETTVRNPKEHVALDPGSSKAAFAVNYESQSAPGNQLDLLSGCDHWCKTGTWWNHCLALVFHYRFIARSLRKLTCFWQTSQEFNSKISFSSKVF